VQATDIPTDDRPDAPLVKVTISIGVTTKPADEPAELTGLLAAADSALYQAKHAGRNRVAAAAPERYVRPDATFKGTQNPRQDMCAGRRLQPPNLRRRPA
jgi:predicted signal transduction protein with EAL and GGDEF domain